MAITAAMRTQVSQFYVAMFGRAPDSEGLGFWVDMLNGGASLAQVANTMFATTPAREYYPSWFDNEQIVTSFYVNVLGRQPDEGGLRFWLAKMNEAGATPGSVISQIINVVANYTGSHPDGLVSAALFRNKVEVAQYYGEHGGSIEGATDALAGVTANPLSVIDAKARIDGGDLISGDTTVLTTGQDNFAGLNAGGEANDLYIGAASSSFVLSGTQTTFNPGDRIDGGEGHNTLRLFMNNGAVADGVQVQNIQTLDLRLESVLGLGDGTARVVMTDWDTSLEQINIRSNKSNLSVEDQQTIASISISDQSGVDRSSSYSFGYAAGVLDGENDTVAISVDNVNGSDGSSINIDAGMEGLDLTVADRAGAQYASNVNLNADGVLDITVDGGRAGQDFTLNANVAAGASLDSTAFAGNLNLDSADIKTANLGAGNDDVVIRGQADESDSSYNLGAGNNTLSIGTMGEDNGLNLAGDVTAGAGNDAVTVWGDVESTGSIALGNGTNTAIVNGVADGSITAGTGDDVVETDGTGANGSIDVGSGDNVVSIYGLHQGSISTGAGDDDVFANATGEDSSINVGDGANSVMVGVHLGAIIGGTGVDTVSVASTGADSEINVAGGNNVVTIAFEHAGLLSAGAGDDTVSAGWTAEGSAMSLGDGANTVAIDGTHAGSITTGSGSDSITVGESDDYANVDGGSISTGGGTDTVQIWGDVDGGSINVGAGNGNDVHVDSHVLDGSTITFGDGDNNDLDVGGDVLGSSVTFGNGAGNTFSVGDDVAEGATITLGNGGNSGTIGHAVLEGAQVTFGSGADSLTIGTQGEDYADPLITGEDVATVVDMGAGNDQVTLLATGEDYFPGTPSFPQLVQSGGFIRGGNGDDTLTLNTEGSIELIARTMQQVATIDLSAQEFEIGDVITVTFTRGDESFDVTLTADEIIQGAENLAAAVADALADELDVAEGFNASDDGSGVITITSEQPHLDWGITWKINEGTAVDAEVNQISDARISSFETLELVALDTEGEDGTVIQANFDLIDGTHTIELDSQVDRVKTENEYYDTYSDGGVTTFELTNLKGGEAIHVSGNEASATGNQQVEKIVVGADVEDHEVGDKISVSFGDVTIDYIVTAQNLAGDTSAIDAQRIAASLESAIRAAAEEAGFTLTRDGNELWLVNNTAGDYESVGVTHTREETNHEVLSASGFGDLDLNGVSNLHDLQVGDKIVLTVGAMQWWDYVQESDLDDQACDRTLAERIAAKLNTLAWEATNNWGVVNFNDGYSLTVTRTVDNYVGETYGSSEQGSTSTDDSNIDVFVDASLAEGATDTTMDLTVHGTGSFDIALTVGESANPYTDLDLKLGDEYSHFIDTNGDEGSFAESITVSNLEGVDNAGQSLELANVLAHDVDTSAVDADVSISQYYGVRNADAAAFEGETIHVTTGAGDDRLDTLAQSAINEGSSIDLGEGENSLTLAWGDGVTLGGADLEDVGTINYAGNLTELAILNNVRLTAGTTTTLGMPGGVEDVSRVIFANVDTTDGSDANLTIEGSATDFLVGAGVYPDPNFNFDLGATGDQVGRLLVEGNVENLQVGAYGDVRFNIDNSELSSLQVQAGEDATIVVANNDGREFNVGDVEIHGGLWGWWDNGAEFGVWDNSDSTVTTSSVTLQGEDYANVLVQNNLDSEVNLGDVSATAGEDASLEVTGNSDSSITVGTVSLRAENYWYGTNADVVVSNNYRVDVESKDISVHSAGSDAHVEVTYNFESNISLASDGTIDLASCDNDAEVHIIGNSTQFDPTENGPDEGAALRRTFEITLGDVNLDGGDDADFVIVGNSDGTYFGDLEVNVGDVNAKAYENAEMVVAENFATTVTMGDVNLLSKQTVSLDMYGNHGQTYVTLGGMGGGFLPTFRREIDYAETTFGDVTLESTHADAWLWVSDSAQATVDMGDVSIKAATDVDVNIFHNGGEDWFGSQMGLMDFQAHTGTITIDSGVDTTFSISDNAAWATGYFGLFSDSTSTVEITTGAIDVTAGSDVFIDIDNNDALSGGEDMDTEATVTVDLESITVDAGHEVNINIEYNDAVAVGWGYYGSDDTQTSTVDVTVGPVVVDAGEDATLFIYYNEAHGASDGDATTNVSVLAAEAPADEVSLAVHIDAVGSGTVEINGNDASTGEDYSPYSDASTATVNIEVGNVQIDAGDGANFDVWYHDAESYNGTAAVDVQVGDVKLTSDTYAYFQVYDNNAYADESGYLSDATTDDSTATMDVTVGAVNITAGYTYVTIEGNDATAIDGGSATSTFTVDTVDVVSTDEVYLYISDNDADAYGEDGGGDATMTVSVSDVDVDADGYIEFSLSDNDAFGGADGEDNSATVTIDVDSVNLNGGASVDFSISDNYATGEDASVAITLGSVDVTASDDVYFTVWDNVDGGSDADQNVANVTLGDVHVDAGNDVTFVVDGYASTSTTLGDVTIDAGLDAAASDASGDISSYVYAGMSDVHGTTSVDISADSHGDGEGCVFAEFDNVYDLSEVTVSGTNAELYFFNDIGASSSDDFTLDLSGMTGHFDDVAENLWPAGDYIDYASDDYVDPGTYVVNVDANFGDGKVIVKIGSGDLVYNAQSSSFGEDDVNNSNWYFTSSDADVDFRSDWNGSDGWYSLGADLDLEAHNEVRTLTFGSLPNQVSYSYGEDSTASFTVEYNSKTYTIELDFSVGNSDASVSLVSDDVGGSLGWADLINDIGNGAAINVSFDNLSDLSVGGILTVDITGNNDGSDISFGNVSDLNGSDVSGDHVSDLVTTEGDLAHDGVGNGAGEVFTFVGDSIGEVVIGGFQPNGFPAEISGEVDRIDLSHFADIQNAGDLIITWDDTDGYFADVVIDFVNSDYGSIRLVGAGEFFDSNNVNGIANSIIFA